jgi:hypothetical protein
MSFAQPLAVRTSNKLVSSGRRFIDVVVTGLMTGRPDCGRRHALGVSLWPNALLSAAQRHVCNWD